jgi:type IV pilus assembly protein PilF
MQKISYREGKYMSARAFLERYLAVAKHRAKTLWYAVKTENALGNKVLADKYKTQLFTLFPASKETQQLKRTGK